MIHYAINGLINGDVIVLKQIIKVAVVDADTVRCSAKSNRAVLVVVPRAICSGECDPGYAKRLSCVSGAMKKTGVRLCALKIIDQVCRINRSPVCGVHRSLSLNRDTLGDRDFICP